MEIRRAIFLRARSHDLEKLAYPVSLRVFGELRRTGTEWFSNWQADKHLTNELTEESGEEKQGYLQEVM